MRHITKEELKDDIDSGANITIVEALPEKYWKEAHIPGSVQINKRGRLY